MQRYWCRDSRWVGWFAGRCRAENLVTNFATMSACGVRKFCTTKNRSVNFGPKAGSDDDALWRSAQKPSKRHAAAAASSAVRKAPAPPAAPRKARASATALASGDSAPMATASPSAASSAALLAPIPVASAAALSSGTSVPSAATTSPCAVLPSTPGGVHEWPAPLNSAEPACDVSIDAYETN